MSDRTMIDSAYPMHPEPDRQITLVYIGGDTPHPWTAAEIRAMPSQWIWPCWVRSDPQQVDAGADAAACLARLAELGVPSGTCVILDLETAIDAAYVHQFNVLLRAAGYKTTKYGSKDFIWQNPQTDGGTFVADPTGSPHMDGTGDTVATQYLFGTYDLSLVKDQAIVPLWDISGTTPAPWEVTLMQHLPTLKTGATGDPVRRVQALLHVAGGRLIVDGVFGPETEHAVKAVQAAHHVAGDGVVGEHTWAVLVTGADL